MSNPKFTYNLKWIIPAIVIWEVIFWVIYYLISQSFGFFSSEHAGEQLMYKSPEALNGAFGLLIIVGVFIFNLARTNKAVKNMPPRVLQSYTKPVSSMSAFMKYFLFRNAFIFLVFAMAQPVFGSKKSSGTLETLELVVCLDVSNSMNTRDISDDMSRLDISKRALVQLVNNLHGERIGICLFANNAFVQLPITKDYNAAKLFIKDIQTNMISSQGTNIDAALTVAEEMFSEERTTKGIIMVTDGENHETNPQKILSKIKESQIQLAVMGIGTEKGGLIPETADRPELGYKKTATGKSVVSKLNKSFIRDIAAKGGGKAYISSSEFPDLSALLTQINQMKRTKIDNLEFDIKQERYRIPLAISIIFWLTYLLWSGKYFRFLDKMIQKG